MVESSAKLTKRTVDAATPRPGRYIVWDTELKGFALRVAASGTKTYILRYRPRGTGRAGPRRFMVLGRHGVMTPDEARAQAKTILGAVAAGKDPPPTSGRRRIRRCRSRTSLNFSSASTRSRRESPEPPP